MVRDRPQRFKNNDAMDGLLEAAAAAGVTLDVGDEPTPADVAVQVRLRAPALLEQKHAEHFLLQRRRTFEYFQSPDGVDTKYRAPGAKKLRARLADLDAAENLDQVRVGRPHWLKGDFAGCLSLDLDGGRRLVIKPANNPLPVLPDGSVDRCQVTRVRVEYIGNYHD